MQRWLFERYGVTSRWWLLMPLVVLLALVAYGVVWTVGAQVEPMVGYECIALYAKAETATDTQAVDGIRVPLNPGKGSTDQLYCGHLRTSGRLARWDRQDESNDSVSDGG